jgi:hypothetical protein
MDHPPGALRIMVTPVLGAVVIIVQDIHQVIGERELDFEDAHRDVFVTEVAASGGRVLWFGWLPHGGGEGYEAVSITAFADLPTWDTWSERLRYGDLAEWATGVDAMRYTLVTSLHTVADWSWLSSLSLESVPATVEDGHSPVLFRLDSIETSSGIASTVSALHSASTAASTELLEPVACWSSLFGDVAGQSVHMLYRVGSRERLADALDDQDAQHVWLGSIVAAAGLTALRTRLLRTVRWSPLS